MFWFTFTWYSRYTNANNANNRVSVYFNSIRQPKNLRRSTVTDPTIKFFIGESAAGAIFLSIWYRYSDFTLTISGLCCVVFFFQTKKVQILVRPKFSAAYLKTHCRVGEPSSYHLTNTRLDGTLLVLYWCFLQFFTSLHYEKYMFWPL